MAQEIADILEVADAKGRVTTTALLLEPLRDTAPLIDTVLLGIGTTFRETASFTDGLDGKINYDLREVAVLAGTASGSTVHTLDLREQADLSDALSSIVIVVAETLHEAAEFADAAIPDTRYIVDLRETAQLEAAASFGHIRRTTLREQAELNDALYAFSIPQDVRETAALGDMSSSRLRSYADIHETAVVVSGADALLGHAVDINEVGTLGDRVTSVVVRNANIREQGYLTNDLDSIITADPNTIPAGTDPVEVADTDAWTANVENWAMSEYRLFPITQQVNGYGFGPGGTFTAAATGENMTSFFQTGTFELAKNASNTRIMWVWFESELSANLTLRATTRNVREYESSHEYELWDVINTDVQKYRYKIGRGQRGRRWSLQMMAQNDTAFAINRLMVARVDAV